MKRSIPCLDLLSLVENVTPLPKRRRLNPPPVVVELGEAPATAALEASLVDDADLPQDFASFLEQAVESVVITAA